MELEATVKSLVDDRKRQELEWDDTYEKFRLLYVRLSKRLKQANRSPEGEDTRPEESAELGEQPQTSALSPRAQEAQRRILARRGKVVQ